VTATTVAGRPVVVAGCADGTVLVHHLAGSHRAGTVVGRHPAAVTAVAALGTDAHLLVVTGGADRTARIWQAPVSGAPRRPARSTRSVQHGSVDCVLSCAALRLSRAGVPMVAFSAGEDVRLWFPGTPVTAMELLAPATALAFDRDNTLLVGTERGVLALAVPEPALPRLR
jgi:hypothetical protein